MVENEQILLGALPDRFILSFDGMEFLKAVDTADSKKRNVYFKASDESLDMQDDSVLMTALKDSKDYFLAKGNFDYGHYSKIPYKVLIGVAPEGDGAVRVPRMFELGQPTEVVFDKASNSTFVKGTIYDGMPLSDWFWKTLNANPPMRWYPSIGGATLEKAIAFEGGKQIAHITKVRWSNIGFTQEPINSTGVSGVSSFPIGKFFKSFDGGIDLEKAMDAKSVAPLIAEDLEGAAHTTYHTIRANPKKYRPILKSYLCKKFKTVDEPTIEKHLDKIFN